MHAKPLTLLSVVTGLSLVVGACGSDSLTLPSEGEAASIAVYAGGGQTARVGEQLGEPLAVQVTDTKDRPVIGATVAFALEDGSGSTAAPTSVITGDSGIARTAITLGTRVGVVTGQARIVVDGEPTQVQTDFVATALPLDANGIAMVAGDLQSAPVGTALPASLVVRVTDAFGNPVSGVPVNWTTDGGGSVSAASTLTDVNGQTSVQRTLGPTAGPQTTSATADLAGSPIIFNHTATAGNAARVLVFAGDGQEAAPGARLPEPLVVQVLDAQSNPIVGRAVTWVIGIGDGSVDPATSNTDGEGKASTQWTLGPEPGRNTVNAVVSGVGVGAFNATARAPKISSSTSIVSHQPEPSTVGQPVEIQVQVSGSGGTPTGTVNVTGENASAPCTITLSNGAGACSLTFNADGQQRVTATYSGDGQFNASDDNENHQVTGPPNLPPVATADQYSTEEDVPLTVPAPTGVLANDADLNGDPLTAIKDSDPSHGTVTLNSDGSFTYTPTADYAGSDAFTYHASDGSGVSAPVTVTITVNPVNDAPAAHDDDYNAPGGEAPLDVPDANGVLANDTDAEGGLTAQNASDPPLGSITLRPEGGFTYVPDAGVTGQDSFTYEATDGTLTSTAIVRINIP